MSSAKYETPFHLTGTLNGIPNKSISRPMETMLEHIFSIKKLDNLYRSLAPSHDDLSFLKQVFELLKINYQVAQEELEHIPATGPLVVVANHPFGAIEGVIIAAMLKQVRPDVKIMANFLLNRIPEMRDMLIPVNPFGGKSATRTNIKPLKESLRWLKQDGLLVVFPAGEVSHLNPVKRQVLDPEWSPSIGRLIQLAEAPVQNIYFHGANSLLFHLIGMLHPLLRTAMLPRELINKTNTTIPIRISKVLPYSRLQNIDDEQMLINYLKIRTYLLDNTKKHVPGNKPNPVNNATNAATIIAAIDKTNLQREIKALPFDQCLVDGSPMQVYFADAKQIPNILQEIGRLREITFRQVGEGTNKSVDLDVYDAHYLHLFIWNSESAEIVGAYRLGQADKIMKEHGIDGLYSYSLFKYPKRLIHELNPALELGRSFVRQEYQKHFSPLLMLWRGIARYVYQHPQYQKVFGLVSISSEYQPQSQKLLVDYLKSDNAYPELARIVKPRTPFNGKSIRLPDNPHSGVGSADHLSDLISEIESDAKGIPILLKQYLKLGGQILGFNMDKNFNNTLDGMIMIDLLHTEKKVLGKYMGKDEVESFHDFHQPRVNTIVNL